MRTSLLIILFVLLSTFCFGYGGKSKPKTNVPKYNSARSSKVTNKIINRPIKNISNRDLSNQIKPKEKSGPARMHDGGNSNECDGPNKPYWCK